MRGDSIFEKNRFSIRTLDYKQQNTHAHAVINFGIFIKKEIYENVIKIYKSIVI